MFNNAKYKANVSMENSILTTKIWSGVHRFSHDLFLTNMVAQNFIFLKSNKLCNFNAVLNLYSYIYKNMVIIYIYNISNTY
jgi:hypothetical protein